MDLNKLTMFKLLKGQMGWLNRRQEVLAQNVANADTPGYKPRDLAPMDFEALVKGQNKGMDPVRSSSVTAAGANGSGAQPSPGTQGQDEPRVASANPLRQGNGLSVTHPMHFQGNRADTSPFTEATEDAPWETSPNGNAVVLEEQMAKIGEVQVQHRLTTELYRKHIGMIKIAIGKGR